MIMLNNDDVDNNSIKMSSMHSDTLRKLVRTWEIIFSLQKNHPKILNHSHKNIHTEVLLLLCLDLTNDFFCMILFVNKNKNNFSNNLNFFVLPQEFNSLVHYDEKYPAVLITPIDFKQLTRLGNNIETIRTHTMCTRSSWTTVDRKFWRRHHSKNW